MPPTLASPRHPHPRWMGSGSSPPSKQMMHVGAASESARTAKAAAVLADAMARVPRHWLACGSVWLSICAAGTWFRYEVLATTCGCAAVRLCGCAAVHGWIWGCVFCEEVVCVCVRMCVCVCVCVCVPHLHHTRGGNSECSLVPGNRRTIKPWSRVPLLYVQDTMFTSCHNIASVTVTAAAWLFSRRRLQCGHLKRV